ncbi:putative adhesin [Massilia horti]|uniref:Putative adhesin Stv domain-containing protein n=1 Tax=Massilia horti TaxID=2562153 RepID=A0A4Y9SYZ2_9BURK|nr:hypothetical protein [Massilia horti]TFW31980.1 hypothetical protein E4O92_11640 [Massilia horti]
MAYNPDTDAAIKTFICGHGQWDPKDGYTQVPKNCRLTFYTENAKWMNSHEVFELIKGTPTLSPASSHGPYKTVPNMRFFPDDPPLKAYSKAIKPADVSLVFTTQARGKQLSELFHAFVNASVNFDIVWACCRDLNLRPTGYKAVRVEQRVDGYYGFDFDARIYSKVYNAGGNLV